MHFAVLGPVEVRDARDGAVVPIAGARSRGLLAALLVHRGRPVSTGALIAALWPGTPPPDARAEVQAMVGSLRRAVGPGRLVTRAPGYVLEVDAHELDLALFDDTVAAARRAGVAGRHDAAADLLRDALALWRGAPLADAAAPGLAAVVARLDEQRMAALADRVDADLACGRHAELVAELTELAAAHPLRERLRAQLVVALRGDAHDRPARAARHRPLIL